MRIEFLPGAEEEFREAVRYYEKQVPGVELTFAAEVRKGIAFILDHPYTALSVGTGLRRKVLPHFPYSVLYSVEADLIVVVAVTHQKRRPRYWHGRIRELRERRGRTT
ncbi:MAG: type II toxin-antitoxin system RelE/ParE family toxin [Candidatus Hydrogenedentes bacterium]|nr:type II toxin-antitoxin system RelE/ParE family toxin [Candidatus Hydrogenedentota bacterium]